MDDYVHPLILAMIVAGAQTNEEYWYWREIFHNSLQNLLRGGLGTSAYAAVGTAELIAREAVRVRRRHELERVSP